VRHGCTQQEFHRSERYLGGVTAMRELLQLTPTYEQVEGGWTQAWLLELPGVITAGPSREEAEDMLVDALREFLLSFSDGLTPATTAASPEGLMLTVHIGPAPAA
jgi:predicted RNase H-like HicB family nuclease